MEYTHLQRTWLIKLINQVADMENTTVSVVDDILTHIKENYNLKSDGKTRLIEWNNLNLLPNRVQNILIMIYEENYKNGTVIYLEDLKWGEFRRYRQAGYWSWTKFQKIRGY